MMTYRINTTIFFLLITLVSQGALADWKTAPEVFETIYYADANPGVRDAFDYNEEKLIRHWKKNGLKEGRTSSPVLAVRFYLQQNPDLEKAFGKKNYEQAAKHWFTTGIGEGRPSHPEFKVKSYLKKNPDIARQYGKQNYEEAVKHYLNNGYKEGRKAN